VVEEMVEEEDAADDDEGAAAGVAGAAAAEEEGVKEGAAGLNAGAPGLNAGALVLSPFVGVATGAAALVALLPPVADMAAEDRRVRREKGRGRATRRRRAEAESAAAGVRRTADATRTATARCACVDACVGSVRCGIRVGGCGVVRASALLLAGGWMRWTRGDSNESQPQESETHASPRSYSASCFLSCPSLV
jgi:hypothetical protein